MAKKDFFARVRSTEQHVEKIRKAALKYGSTAVSSRSVGVNTIETVANFSKRRDGVDFLNWLTRGKYGDIYENWTIPLVTLRLLMMGDKRGSSIMLGPLKY